MNTNVELTTQLRQLLLRLDALDAERRARIAAPPASRPHRRLVQIDADTRNAERALAKLIKENRDQVWFLEDGSVVVMK